MKHEKTVIYFTKKDKSYRVEYGYNDILSRNVLIEKDKNYDNGFEDETLQARVFENEICIKLFNQIPPTNTVNPTKSQAKELIKLALKK